MDKKRIEWVDGLKCLGMLAIYVGHFGNDAGHLYSFVFRYHVPLFFFMAGFFSSKGLSKPAFQFLVEKTKTVLIPYFFFSALLLLFYSTNGSWNLSQVSNAFVNYFYGIRNTPFVGSLWFINCIFVMLIIDYIASRIVRNQAFVLLLSILAMVISIYAFENNPRQTPSIFWNIDSALSYWVYMVSGRLLYPVVNKLLCSTEDGHKTIRIVLFTFSVMVGVAFYYQGPNWLPLIAPKLFTGWISEPSYILYGLFGSFTLIYLNCYIALYVSRSKMANTLGQASLGLCGMENITKNIIPLVIGTVGLQFSIKSPVVALAYAVVCLLVSNYMYEWIKRTIPNLFK
ncbi:acyltransferase [Escherichia coli]|uniref:acyltransferase n=1 Tax=Escherichia coli TaxID=562 RepID=UPI0017A14AB7|nr:acyltransferase [Escherichia coli]EGI4356024.1 acyltransferase [Escherichia coli]EIP3276444.1 acyltransferase [Escherichia coli]HAY0196010.1 acyltransferase [Escherichia coli]